MRQITIILFIFFVTKTVFATEVRHSCVARNPLTNVATIGDSRAEQLGAEWTQGPWKGMDFISSATLNSMPILKQGQIFIQDLGQVGSTATDCVY